MTYRLIVAHDNGDKRFVARITSLISMSTKTRPKETYIVVMIFEGVQRCLGKAGLAEQLVEEPADANTMRQLCVSRKFALKAVRDPDKSLSSARSTPDDAKSSKTFAKWLVFCLISAYGSESIMSSASRKAGSKSPRTRSRQEPAEVEVVDDLFVFGNVDFDPA